MSLRRKLVVAAMIGPLWLSGRAVLAADDQEAVLRKLDVAAANFHSTTAEFTFDTEQINPVPDSEIQKGTVDYERKGTAFKMAAHIREVNGKPVPKDLTYAGGKVMLFDRLANEVYVKNAAKYEGYLLLGFGASGKELADKWAIKYLGPETLDGVKTEKLELVAKDPDVLKLFPKVTVWVDPEKAVSLKVIFDEGQGATRTCTYSHIKINQPLPGDAFTLKTDSKTQFKNQ
jgi:outer membrane lipoprotein-sorting protein